MNFMRRFSAMLASLSLALILSPPSADAAEHAFAVIASPAASEGHLSRERVALIFKRKLQFWDNGTRIQPVNLPATNALRRYFSQNILGNLPEGMEDYWQEMYFHGVLPPHVLASEEAVILFVLSTPGAIGYVSSCLPEHRVNVVLSIGDLPACNR